MERYEKGPKLGQGTFGTVVSAKRKVDGRVVAIKCVESVGEGLPFTALREIKVLSLSVCLLFVCLFVCSVVLLL